MTALGRPAILVVLFVSAAFVLHPAVRSAQWLPERHAGVTALLLLVAIALLVRALATAGPGRLAAWLWAAGAILVVGGVGGDGLLGHRGTLDLVPGQTRTHFDEVGVEGRALGLRPFGFTVGLKSILPGGGVALVRAGSSDPWVLTPERAVGHGGFRFGRPRTVPTGAAARLRIAISGGGSDMTVDVEPGRQTQAGDLRVALQEYFPDFALDEQQQPFTRSREPRNPGAVLAVESPHGAFRAFVLRSMPGVHRVEELGRSFALIGVEPAMSVEIDVHREPLAALVLLGALLVLAAVIVQTRTLSAAILATGGTVLFALQPQTTAPVTAVLLGLAVAVAAGALLLRVRGRRANGADALEPALFASVLLAVVLARVDHGAVLSWTFGVAGATGRVVLPGVGVALGAALVAALGGALLLTAGRLAPEASGARPVAVGALWAAVLAAALGAALTAARLAELVEGVGEGGARSLAVLVVAVGTLAACLLEASGPATSDSDVLLVRAARLNHVAVALALVAAVAAGVESWWREATYATPLTMAAAAAALLGFAALEPEARLAGTRQVLFLAALLVLVFA